MYYQASKFKLQIFLQKQLLTLQNNLKKVFIRFSRDGGEYLPNSEVGVQSFAIDSSHHKWDASQVYLSDLRNHKIRIQKIFMALNSSRRDVSRQHMYTFPIIWRDNLKPMNLFHVMQTQIHLVLSPFHLPLSTYFLNCYHMPPNGSLWG